MEIARVPKQITVPLPTAGTIVQQDISVDATGPSIKKIQIKSRTKTDDLKYQFQPTGDFVTIPGGQTYWQDNLQAWLLSLYLTGTVNGQVAEVEYWL